MWTKIDKLLVTLVSIPGITTVLANIPGPTYQNLTLDTAIVTVVTGFLVWLAPNK